MAILHTFAVTGPLTSSPRRAARKELIDMDAVAKTAGQQRGRPFQPGHSGNPRGRPVGSRHKATWAAEALLDDEAEELTRTAINLAKSGDTTALRLCLERLCPPRRDR